MNRILIAIAAVIVVVGAVFLLSNTTNNTGDTNQTTTTTTQTEPTATSTPTIQDEMSNAAVTLTMAGFNPKVITVKAGATVIWTNSSGQVGNVSSNPHPTHSIYPALNLGNFGDGQGVSLVFDTVGTYGYHNHLDATKTGTVIVVE